MAQDDIRGTVVDSSSNAVSGAVVEVAPARQDATTAEDTVVRTTTDSNGDYIIDSHPFGDGTTKEWHVSAYYWDGSAWVNSLNKPGVTADLSSLIPDSVVHQYPYSTFSTSTWSDNVGGAGMTVNGMVSDTFGNGESSVFGDGTDDYGLADGPQNLPQNETFGVALTLEDPSGSDTSYWMGSSDGNASIWLYDSNFTDGTTGEMQFAVQDNNGNSIIVETDSSIADGNIHLIVWNKNSNSAAGVDIYVDDMSTTVPTTAREEQAFDHTNYTNAEPMGFFAERRDGSINNYKSYDAGIFEFNTEPYTQTERDELKARRPEV